MEFRFFLLLLLVWWWGRWYIVHKLYMANMIHTHTNTLNNKYCIEKLSIHNEFSEEKRMKEKSVKWNANKIWLLYGRHKIRLNNSHMRLESILSYFTATDREKRPNILMGQLFTERKQTNNAYRAQYVWKILK